jgi:hypothetical protein
MRYLRAPESASRPRARETVVDAQDEADLPPEIPDLVHVEPAMSIRQGDSASSRLPLSPRLSRPLASASAKRPMSPAVGRNVHKTNAKSGKTRTRASRPKPCHFPANGKNSKCYTAQLKIGVSGRGLVDSGLFAIPATALPMKPRVKLGPILGPLRVALGTTKAALADGLRGLGRLSSRAFSSPTFWSASIAGAGFEPATFGL